MLDFSVETKSQLAKLLATENINIEHQNTFTAKFNLETRTLVCPIWEDMSGQMYDLLLGHEVSHALETPLQGWHDAICDRGKNYKHFLNVVEDARIEKKIKRRYPGIRRSFIGAYSQLLERDFFGIADKDVNKMFFIDRLNIYCKAGINSKVNFVSNKEKELLKLVENAETWNDVVYATEKVWEYSKEEQKQDLPKHDVSDYEYDFGDSELPDDYEDSPENDDVEDAENEETEKDSEPTDNKNIDVEDSDDAEDAEDAEDADNEEVEDGEVSEDAEDTDEKYGDPKCESDEAFRKNEDKLISSKIQAYNYISIPQLKSKEMITSPKDINEIIQNYVDAYRIDAVKLHNEFKTKNEKYIGLLAKEFEMRKAAKSYSKSKMSSTGDIDINKIYKYQLDDEIFRKATIVPKGKSHGLVLLLDMSGSMSKNMTGSVEQIQVLTSFCRKVNIPFTVYGFTSKNFDDKEINECFVQENNTLQFSQFKLIEFVNSKMKSSDFNNAIKNLSVLAYMYEESSYNLVPPELNLGRTPLIESLVTLNPIVKDFRKTNNLDIVNLIIVHDGDADSVDTYKSEGFNKSYIGENSSQRYMLRDTKQKLDFLVNSEQNISRTEMIRQAIFEWFKQTTGTKIFGFYITSDSKHELVRNIESRYYDANNKKITEMHYPQRYHSVQEKITEIKKEKILVSKNPGYEQFYLILGGKNLKIENEELTVNGKVTVSKLYNSLRKINKNKQVNRILATKFIEGIAI
jgi:cobalamin biosynthesis protein CobT